MTVNDLFRKFVTDLLPEVLDATPMTDGERVSLRLIALQPVHMFRDMEDVAQRDLDLAFGVVLDSFLLDLSLKNARLLVDGLVAVGILQQNQADGVLGDATPVATLARRIMMRMADD